MPGPPPHAPAALNNAQVKQIEAGVEAHLRDHPRAAAHAARRAAPAGAEATFNAWPLVVEAPHIAQFVAGAFARLHGNLADLDVWMEAIEFAVAEAKKIAAASAAGGTFGGNPGPA